MVDLAHLCQVAGHVTAHSIGKPGTEDSVTKAGEHVQHTLPFLCAGMNTGVDGGEIQLHRLVTYSPHVLLKQIPPCTGINMTYNLPVFRSKICCGDQAVFYTVDIWVLQNDAAEFLGKHLLVILEGIAVDAARVGNVPDGNFVERTL